MNPSVKVVIIISMLAFGAASAPAEQLPKPWQPTVPDGVPADFDWIRLASDEWLKGEVVSMYDGVLEFDSDELDTLTFDFEDVKEIRTAQVIQVGFEDREPAIGRLLVGQKTAAVIGESDEIGFPRSEILTLIVGMPKEVNYWSASATVGGNIRSGNTEQLDYSARLGVMRRSLKHRTDFTYLGNVTTIDDVDTSNNHRVDLGWDYFLNRRLFVNVLGAQWFSDEFQNIQSRLGLTAGLGYEIVDSSRTSWNVVVGPAWQSTEYVSVEPGEDSTVDSPAFGLGTRLDQEITGDVDYYFDYRGYVTDEESGSYNHHLDTGFDIDLIGNLDLNVSWVWDRIEEPRPLENGSLPKQDDYRLIFGVGWDF